MVYSVFKELDFTTSLIDGPYADTSFGEVYRKALKLTDGNDTVLADFKVYQPSYDSPASFMASPIVDGAKVVGILVFQMPIEDMNTIMGERAGMGETGETYLVGPDKLMRSDSFLDPEHHNVVSSFKVPEKGAVDTDAVTAALAGNTGVSIIQDYNDNPVVSAYQPLDLGDVTWAVMAEQDVAEAFAAADSLKSSVVIKVVITVLVVAGLAWAISRSIAQPINRVAEAIKQSERNGAFSHQVRYQGDDEIGQMAAAFDRFTLGLAEMFSDANRVLEAVNRGDYSARTSGRYVGDVGNLCEGINNTVAAVQEAQQEQVRQQGELEQASIASEAMAEQAREVAAEASRVREALDNASTAVLIADANGRAIYENDAMSTLVGSAAADLRRVIPGLHESVIGSDVNYFQGIAGQVGGGSREVTLGEHTFQAVVNTIVNDSELVGMVVELRDRTEEVAMEADIDAMIASVGQGDFSHTLVTQGKQGFFLSLASGLNTLASTTESALKDVTLVLQQMSEGDLTRKIDGDYQGLFGELQNSVNTTVERLTGVVEQISESANAVSTGSREIADGVQDLSRRTEQQASALEETVASTGQMASNVQRSSDNATNADTMARDAQQKALNGGEVVKNAVDAMSAINAGSKRISEIVGVIDEIAFQTNLPALNAAVEAARAGEQGRGFAVVAGEVRRLAQRSANAAKEIKELINDNMQRVNNGSELVDQSGETLRSIVMAVEKGGTAISELASAAQEQSTGIRQIDSAVGSMDEMTQQNSALVEQASAAAESIAEQSRAMAGAVEFFRTH